MNFTAKDVAALRETTGCGMMDCKKALTEADGNVDKAIELLREKGLAAQAKKAGRIASEGMVDTYIADGVGVMIEVNSETDFVAKNAEFQALVKGAAKAVAVHAPADIEALKACKFEDTEFTVEDVLREKILKIGASAGKSVDNTPYQLFIALYQHFHGFTVAFFGQRHQLLIFHISPLAFSPFLPLCPALF